LQFRKVSDVELDVIDLICSCLVDQAQTCSKTVVLYNRVSHEVGWLWPRGGIRKTRWCMQELRHNLFTHCCVLQRAMGHQKNGRFATSQHMRMMTWHKAQKEMVDWETEGCTWNLPLVLPQPCCRGCLRHA